MKVLLLHEMSGVHTELKNGLSKIGVQADIATHGDGFKRFKSDIDLGSIDGSLTSHLQRVKNQVLLAKTFGKYDVVQSISPEPFYTPISRILDQILAKSNCKKVYIAAGSDAIYRHNVRSLDYYPPHDWFEDHKMYRSVKNRIKTYDTIVPVCWEYKYSMEQSGFSPKPVLPFPIDLEKHKPIPIKGKRKIVFFHPLNRNNLNYDFKGTLIIQKAFKILENRYSHIAEFICKGNMSYSEYDEFTNNVDVIVDQLYSYSYGMSAALGMAKGKIVISGLEPKAISNVPHFASCPVINAKPSVDSVIEKIEVILENLNLVDDLKSQSRLFAEQYHCSIKVAQELIDTVY